VRDRQIESGERGVEGVALVEKRPADPGQKPAGPFVISEAGGDQGGRLAQVTTFSMESSSASSDLGSFRSMR
jgi:hypothetical protein